MSRKSDIAKLESIEKYISDISKIILKHGDIQNALLDTEGQYAIMMCLVQIGEIIQKIEDIEIRQKLQIKEASGFRNLIVHNYEGIDFIITEKIVLENIPLLEQDIQKILEKLDLLY
jgi:uncharacterized protein with HEPN domain